MAIVVRELLTVLGYDIQDRDLKKYDSQLGGLSKNLGAVAKSAALAAVAIGTVAATGFIKQLVTTNTEFQKLQAQLDAVTGSAEKGRAAFNLIRDFAVRTPFQVSNLTRAFAALRQIGVEPTERTLQSLGDLASFTGKDITELSAAIQSATTGSFEPLRAFGIFISKQGNFLNVTIDGVTTRIKNNAQSIVGFLENAAGSGSKFAGALEKQINTLSGRFSNLQGS